MAEGKAPVSLYPSPPPFWQHFTKQNLAQLKQLRKDAGLADSATGDTPSHDKKHIDIDVSSLPAELRYLVPPPPPADGKFTTFGADLELDAPGPSLKTFEIDQLYPDTATAKLNPQSQLIAMSRSLLTTFLSLTGVLANDPEQQEPQLTHLQTLIYNMHDLINQYRPHQARESLILLMEERVERMKAEVKRIEESKVKVEKLLRGLQEGELGYAREIEVENKQHKEDSCELKRKSRQRAAWKALDMEMG